MPRSPAELWHGPDRWLHPPGQLPHVIHTGPDGSVWHVSVWWAEKDGQAVPCGIDIRSFHLHGDGTVGPPLPGTSIAPISAALMRHLRPAEIVEQTRQQAQGDNSIDAGRVPRRRRYGAVDRAAAGRAADMLAEAEPQVGRPPDRGDDFIRLVADLYQSAKQKGGQPARQPWAEVRRGLAAAGHVHVTGGQLRNWYRRAVRLGYITTTNKGRTDQ